MQNAAQSGFEAVLVRIWGMGAQGQAFFQNVHAQNFTPIGAQLTGVEQELQTGDVIGVQLGDKKARCKVMQSVDGGFHLKFKVDVELVEGQTCPWKDKVVTQKEGTPKVSPHANKRRFVRHRINYPIELRDDRGGGVPMQTNASDIGGRGCYVETLVPLPLGTPLHIIFWIKEEKISTAAMVRASDPGVGMGIEFIGLSEDRQMRFQVHLDEIDPPRMVPNL
jgi:PilZ domain